MGRKPWPRNQRCPCDSGKKYKHCCFTKGFHFYIDEATGEVSKSVPIDQEARELLQPGLAQQRQRFIDRFGREPGPDDPVFFDINENDIKNSGVAAMKAAGIRPALIYAFEKTGLIVTEQNQHLIPDRDIQEFEDAVAEYYELHPAEDPDVD